MMRVMCGVQLMDKKRARYLMLILGLIRPYISLTMKNSIPWYEHVLKREDGHVLKQISDFAVDGQMKKWRLKYTWKKQVDEESMKADLSKED